MTSWRALQAHAREWYDLVDDQPHRLELLSTVDGAPVQVHLLRDGAGREAVELSVEGNPALRTREALVLMTLAYFDYLVDEIAGQARSLPAAA